MREITSVVYGRNAENEPVSRTKMADYRALVVYSSYLRNETIIRKTPNLITSEHDTETASMLTFCLVASVAGEGRGNTHSDTGQPQ